jgi:predicted NUDIX family NTP pyrophosphohydrolase
MPFTTKTVEEGEAFTKTRATIMKEVAELHSGGISGVIGEVKQEPEPIVEEYTPTQLKKLAKLRVLLIACVEPPKCGKVKATPEDDRKSFVRKVNVQSLSEIKRFFTKEVLEYLENPTEVPIELKEIVERKYRDISP